MSGRLLSFLREFGRDEDGSGTVEVVIFTTLLMGTLVSVVEIGVINLKQALLERAVALEVREIRLSTGDVPDYEEIRADVCDEMAMSRNCEANMMLEMAVAEPASFVGLPSVADCINAEEEPRPSRQFEPGLDNELMLMRACLKYKPLFPTTRLVSHLSMDEKGYAQLVVRAMFVQEPR